MMVTEKDFDIAVRPTWCRGCGNYGILNSVKRAFAQVGIEPHQAIIVTGIGCGSKLPHYMNCNAEVLVS